MRTKYEDPYHKGQPGTRWALFEKFTISRDGIPYLFRWRIVQTPWFGVFVHKMVTMDPDPHCHDHPWPFLSWVVKGGYAETIVSEKGERFTRFWWRWSTHTMPLHSYHRIKHVIVPTWTIVLVGRRVQEWGFLVDGEKVHWRTYLGV